jgi:hypothetical protein
MDEARQKMENQILHQSVPGQKYSGFEYLLHLLPDAYVIDEFHNL